MIKFILLRGQVDDEDLIKVPSTIGRNLVKYIRLDFSNWQRVRSWKRYYIFTPNTEYVTHYYETHKSGIDDHGFKVGRSEVVFDYWKRSIINVPMVSLFGSNKKVAKLFKVKYEFTFDKDRFVTDWYLDGERIVLEYGQAVVPNVIFVLNTLNNTLEPK